MAHCTVKHFFCPPQVLRCSHCQLHCLYFTLHTEYWRQELTVYAYALYALRFFVLFGAWQSPTDLQCTCRFHCRLNRLKKIAGCSVVRTGGGGGEESQGRPAPQNILHCTALYCVLNAHTLNSGTNSRYDLLRKGGMFKDQM